MASITYFILAHTKPEIVKEIINALSSNKTTFYLHIDSKSKEDFSFSNVLKNVYLSSERHSVIWGGFSIIETLIKCCKEILNRCPCDYVALMSGADYPTKSSNYIEQFIEKNKGKDFIEGKKFPSPDCNWIEGGRRRIECYSLHLQNKNIATIEPRVINIGNIRQLFKVILKSPTSILRALKIWLRSPFRRHPSNLTPYYGEMWWVLRKSTIAKIINYLELHPEFISYHMNTQIPDEIFFNTLVYNLIPDDEICNTSLRYINWGDGKRGNSPKDIEIEEKNLIDRIISNPTYLFARKISSKEVVSYINNLVNEKA